MTEVPGIDTIQGLVGSPPQVIELSYLTVKAAEKLRQVWNTKFLAFIPYCFSCKEPLVWHINRSGINTSGEYVKGEDSVIFHCPKCGRKWIKDEEWLSGEEQLGIRKSQNEMQSMR